ncbi:ATP-dependent endonuclease [Pedobacter sp. HMWF019]|uniref:ATP-dependent endonuclease n=1 Tax=Pedobacter sp. HMWF019 TaxID=2056856 RepID=UPI000D3D785D|nr:AAA family ATPase [Pedobacter sp. HMWF019]PTT03693.1 ATP-dependent endonuclease [Pedobacter sp. HMWF019]
MKIEFVHIQNFRKLKDCRIDFTDNQTLFVGANNSGKTTAMDALILFFKLKTKFTTRDFTLSNWGKLNALGEEWCNAGLEDLNLNIDQWVSHLPALDVWLRVEERELHYIHHLIPTLEWKGGLLGIRLRYEPLDINELFREFTSASKIAKSLVKLGKVDSDDFNIWPVTLWDFLDQKSNLNKFFKVHTYLLDPEQSSSPQILNVSDIPIEGDAFNGLIKIDIINAQRGFSDVNSDSHESVSSIKNLSGQLRSYYDKHLNPTINPTTDDINALRAINDAKKLFDQNLKECFKESLAELEILNYPGFGNPTINLSSQFNTLDGLNHESAVQYVLEEGLSLPEKYNGLGYQNLISIIFKLIRFRDEWMQVGKNFNDKTDLGVIEFEPLHLVLIEEPEAHLHAQVQQVFIKKAYEILRSHANLQAGGNFSTQLVISTHSNHIAHEAKFTSLRYFRRSEPLPGISQTSTVVNLSKTFGSDDETTKFAIRYLKTTHCDLFFADAVILVEGPAERMLVPYFIKQHSELDNCYLSLLEIGGSHAHTLKPLIESLGIICLVITDLDSVDPNSNYSKVQPGKSKEFQTGNETIKTWLPKIKDLDGLLVLDEEKKESNDNPIKVAYQIPIQLIQCKNPVEVYPYTFEDSLVLTNLSLFSTITGGTGLIKKMVNAATESDPERSATLMYEAITAKGAKKAEFALELLYFQDPQTLQPPEYINQGLAWIEKKLAVNKPGLKTTRI